MTASLTPLPALLLGRHYAKVGDIHYFPFSDTLTAAITAGKKSSVRRKTDGNEDALAVIPLAPETTLFLIADSHYGALAADVAVSAFQEQLAETQGSWKQRLFQTTFQIDAAITKNKQTTSVHPGCATTLISVVLEQNRLHYAAYGDSRCWLVRDDHFTDLIPIQQGLFLGEQYSTLRPIFSLLEQAQFVDTLSDPAHVSLTCFALLELYHQTQKRTLSDEEIEQVLNGLHKLTGLQTNIPINDFKQSWLDLYLKLERVAPRYGTTTLQQGDRLFLATDGIEEEMSALPAAKLKEYLCADEAIAKRAERIMKACMGWRGGGDNLSFIMIDHP